MKGISPRIGLEIEIEPFIIELASPCSTAPASSAEDVSESDRWSDRAAEKASGTTASPSRSASSVSDCSVFDFLSDADGENLLAFLFSPIEASFTLFETLVQDPSPTSRAAILYYLPLAPVVQRDISTLMLSLLDDEEVMVSLATNIAYYHAHDFISESELEYLLMEILVCHNPEGTDPCIVNSKILDLYHFTHRQIQQYRNFLASRRELDERKSLQQMLKYKIKLREKNWCRKRTDTHQSLDIQWRVQPGVPLPYGCTTIADVFTDVNEMYTSSAPPAPSAPPGLDWAQSRPHSNESKGIYKTLPRINLPNRSETGPMPQTVECACTGTVSDCEGEWFSKTRAPFESLYPYERGKFTDVMVKLPKPVPCLPTDV